MGFLDKIRASVMRFMSGRYGVDQLNQTLVWSALLLTVIGSLTRVRLLTFIGDVPLVIMIWRMLSKDRYRRAEENRKYLEKTSGVRTALSQWITRMKNSKEFHYYKCPQCKALYRVPRGKGQITISCKKCGNKFDKKA